MDSWQVQIPLNTIGLSFRTTQELFQFETPGYSKSWPVKCIHKCISKIWTARSRIEKQSTDVCTWDLQNLQMVRPKGHHLCHF